LKKIVLCDDDPSLLMWKYIGIGGCCFFKVRVCLPMGFDAVINMANKGIETVFGDSSEYSHGDFRNISDVYFVRKHINEPQEWGCGEIPCVDAENGTAIILGLNGILNFSVQNSNMLVKEIAGLGNSVKIKDMTKHLMPELKMTIKNLFLGQTLEKNIGTVSQIINDNLILLSEIFTKYGLRLDSFVVGSII